MLSYFHSIQHSTCKTPWEYRARSRFFFEFSVATNVSGDGSEAIVDTVASLRSHLGLPVSSGVAVSSSAFKHFFRLTAAELKGSIIVIEGARTPFLFLSAY